MFRFLEDLRTAARGLLNNPGFATLAILVLALGIGANTAIFSVVSAVLLRPLPYHAPDRIVVGWESRVQEGTRNNSVSPADYLDWRAQNHVFEALDANDQAEFNLSGSGKPERVVGNLVTADLLATYGVSPILGRGFTPDDQQSPGRVALLAHGFWQRHFGGDLNVIGRVIHLDEIAYRVVGVLPADFRMFIGASPDFYVPLVFSPEDKTDHGGHRFLVVGRLRPGVSLTQAQSEMNTIASRVASAHPKENTGHGVNLVRLSDQLTQQLRPALMALLYAVAFVLLISCANVANLLLARATARCREIAIRRAVGATAGRLVAMLLTESLLLAGLGGVLGVAIARLALRLIPLLAIAAPRSGVPGIDAVTLDGRVLFYSIALSILTGLVFGLAPAWQLLRSSAEDLHVSGRAYSMGRSHRRLRQALVVSEVTIAFTLLTGAALLITSFERLIHVDPGFQAANRLSMRLSIAGPRYQDPPKQIAFYRELLDRVSRLPEVASAGITTLVPGNTWGPRFGFQIEGQPRFRTLEEMPKASWRVISEHYLSTVGIPVLRGRSFTLDDRPESQKVVLLSQATAQRYFGASDPIGKRIAVGFQTEWRTVVGITGNTRYLGLDKDPEPEFYLPFTQFPLPEFALILRSTGRPEALARAATLEIEKIDPSLPVSHVQTVERLLGESVSQQRSSSLLASLFAAIAFALAAGGLYSVMSYLITQRTQEIGVRMALGARPGDVLRMVFREGVSLAVCGVALGMFAALVAGRLMAGFLFVLSPTDPFVYASVAAAVIAVALAATILPALRAARVDPTQALRHD